MTTLGMAVVLLLAMSVSSVGADKAKLPADVKVQKAAAGEVFADSKGMTLYTFDRDTAPGKSACKCRRKAHGGLDRGDPR
jgi:predicted lipoprotein with Yx(FWY)xxD motif